MLLTSYVKLIILYIYVCPSKKIKTISFISMSGRLNQAVIGQYVHVWSQCDMYLSKWFELVLVYTLGSSGDMRYTEQFC